MSTHIDTKRNAEQCLLSCGEPLTPTAVLSPCSISPCMRRRSHTDLGSLRQNEGLFPQSFWALGEADSGSEGRSMTGVPDHQWSPKPPEPAASKFIVQGHQGKLGWEVAEECRSLGKQSKKNS